MSGYTLGEIVVWLVLAAILGFALGWIARELLLCSQQPPSTRAARPAVDAAPAAQAEPVEETPVKKAPAKEAAVKRAPAKKAAAKKSPAKKAAAKKTPAKKAPVKKSPARKAAAPKKPDDT